MGLTDDAHVPIIQYLVGEGLLEWIAQGFVKLTHGGIVAVEETKQGKVAKPVGSQVFPHINIGTLNVTGIAVGLKDFAQAVVDDRNLDQNAKAEVLEHLSTIAEEADKETEKRKKGLMKVMLPTIHNGRHQ